MAKLDKLLARAAKAKKERVMARSSKVVVDPTTTTTTKKSVKRRSFSPIEGEVIGQMLDEKTCKALKRLAEKKRRQTLKRKFASPANLPRVQSTPEQQEYFANLKMALLQK